MLKALGQLILFLISTLLFIAMLLLLHPYDDELIVTSAAVSLFTLGLLWKYAHDTGHMKEQLIRQNDFAQRPIVNLYFRKTNDIMPRHVFKIRNVGNAPAYNILIDPFVVESTSHKLFINETNLILEPHRDEKFLEYMSTSRGSLTLEITSLMRQFDVATVTPDAVRQNESLFAPIVIRYRGLDGRRFYSLFKFYKRHAGTDELILEFIASGEEPMLHEAAQRLCASSTPQRSIYERAYEPHVEGGDQDARL